MGIPSHGYSTIFPIKPCSKQSFSTAVVRADWVPLAGTIGGPSIFFSKPEYHTVAYLHVPYNIFPPPMVGVPCLKSSLFIVKSDIPNYTIYIYIT